MPHTSFLITVLASLTIVADVSLAEEDNDLRIPRPLAISSESRFHAFPSGFSSRWLRNLRQPTFCTMVLCHGTCASPMRSARSPSNLGMPPATMGLTNIMADTPTTPCGLKCFDSILPDAMVRDLTTENSCVHPQ
jgi:hypothetical protein